MKKILILGLVGVMLFGAAYAYAKGPGFGPKYREGSPREDTFSPLTPEQRTKFQELRSKFVEETAQLRGALVTKRIELQSLWTNPQADPKAILDKERELRNIQDQLRDKGIQFKLELRKILTPEQLAQYGTGYGLGWGRGHMKAGFGPWVGAQQGYRQGWCH